MKKILSILLLALAVTSTANAQEFLGNLRNKQAGKGTVTVSQSKDIDDLVNGHARQQQTQQTTTQQTTTAQKTATTQHTTTQQHATTQHTTTATQHTTTTTQHATTATQQHTATQHADPDRVIIPVFEEKKKEPVTTATHTESATTHTEKTVTHTENATPHTEKATPKKDTHTAKQATQDNDEYSIPTVDTSKKVMRRSYRMPGYRIQVFSGGNSRQDKQKAYNAGAVMKANFPEQPVYAHFKSPSWKCRMGNFKSQYEANKYLARVKKLGFPQACVVKDNIQVQY